MCRAKARKLTGARVCDMTLLSHFTPEQRLSEPKDVADEERRFIVTYFTADDTLSVYEETYAIFPKPESRVPNPEARNTRPSICPPCCVQRTRRGKDRALTPSNALLHPCSHAHLAPMLSSRINNSGRTSGKFLERGRTLKPDPVLGKAAVVYYGIEDFVVGAEVNFNCHKFRILQVDEFSRKVRAGFEPSVPLLLRPLQVQKAREREGVH